MRKDIKVLNSKVLLLGFTFKEDCPDVRNTRVIDIYNELRNFDINVEVYDPWVNPQEVNHEYDIKVLSSLPKGNYAAVILAVAHKEFLDIDIRSLAPSGVVFDVKGILSKNIIDSRL
jgi:UDP-N-acetyl-D-galactosamine dehydrogenase